MRNVFGYRLSAVGLLFGAQLAGQRIAPLPDSSGWGVHVLALARAPDSSIWVGTYGQGIFVLRKDRSGWEQIRSASDTAAHAISWDFVHAFGFGPRGEIWYGTVGNGWGLSTDGGKTWKNWELRQLGPEWQYVAPNGIVTRGDTTYIATADGIKVTWDDGATWRVITDSAGATTARDSVIVRIQSQYVLAIVADTSPNMWISTLKGIGHSPDAGRTWHEHFPPAPCAVVGCVNRARSLSEDSGGRLWIGTEQGLYRFGPELGGWGTADGQPCGGRASCPGGPLPVQAFTSKTVGPLGEAARSSPPGKPRHTWFRRPIALADQPYIDQTYRFGSTMGGNFQPHQGVEFNNPDGTPVHAIGDGVVVYSGPAEAGANTIAIRHDRKLNGQYVFSVYYHNTTLLVAIGQRVKAGDVISLVGNTGRATNDHLHLEVHVAPTTDSSKIVDAAVRYPPFNTNPELWIDPLPGTGVVAGQVWDSLGQPVQQARIYGLVKPEPQETPFSFIETYGPRNHSDPAYREHFAIGDVPAGEYVLGVEIDGKRVHRRVRVEAGKLTWVEFRP
ncbi:MAG TPA: peptidoglycan DD-metalloendopeptidase family protein [Gemmatimonadales bacterium]|nr:peptidoglycan DD-metalloendopeptidase family protein [Gemmatimonadales bacterium]